MSNYSPLLFSSEALKLIYKHYSERGIDIDFREMDIELGFCEQSYFDCVKDNDIPVEGLVESDSEYEKMEIAKSAISDFLGAKTDVMGFTSHHTVVYAKNY